MKENKTWIITIVHEFEQKEIKFKFNLIENSNKFADSRERQHTCDVFPVVSLIRSLFW